MIEILDIFTPIIIFTLSSLLTIPVIKAARKRQKEKNTLIFCWFLSVFAIAGVAIANLASKYYVEPPPAPF